MLELYLFLIYFNCLIRCCERSISGIALKGHNYSSITTRDIFDCYYACVEDEKCQSLNYYRDSKTCDLNNRTISLRPGYVHVHGSVYLNNPFHVVIGSSKAVPAVSCLEIKNADETTVSGRYWLYDMLSWKPRKAYCDMKKGVIVECTTSPNPCLNGATCEYYGKGVYKCVCVTGFTGNHCETNINECSSSPCQNGGVCKDKINGYVCECSDLFTEKNCQLAKGSECKNYKNLTEFDRNIVYAKISSKSLCDRDLLVRGWYRFTGMAGSRILDYGVMGNKCRTTTPGWMDGNNPVVSDGIVKRKVCFSWANNLCDYSHVIQVRNCALFYVYELVKPKYCGRYCGID